MWDQHCLQEKLLATEFLPHLIIERDFGAQALGLKK